MYRNTLRTTMVFMLSILSCMVSARAAALSPEIVASTKTNGLEGLDVDAAGAIYVTDATAHLIHKVSSDGTLGVFSQLTVVPQVIVLSRSGAVVTAQEREPDFAKLMEMPAAGAQRPRPLGADVMGQLGAMVVILDEHGNVTKTIHGAPGAFFNGLDRFGRNYLIADSTAGTLWLLDIARGTLTAWFKDSALLGAEGRFPGANGLKVMNGQVYVSNTTGGTIFRLATRAGNPERSLVPIAHVQAPDDFAVSRTGAIYIPSGGKILKISPSGQISTLADGCTGCDSALLADHERSLLLVTHGFGPDAGGGHVYRIRLTRER